jgi:hypothetical protein
MAIAIAILGLWTAIGGGVGSAIAGAVWTQRLPRLLAENLGAYYTPAELAEIYGDIYVAKISEPRAIVIASMSPFNRQSIADGQHTIQQSARCSSRQ